MKRKQGTIAATTLVAALGLVPTLVQAESSIGGAAYIKGGMMSLLDPSQTVGQSGVPTFVHIDRQSEIALDFSWELRLKYGLAVGTEFLRYRNEFAPVSAPAARGTAITNAYLATVKKYFMQESKVRPYAGGGIGYAFTWVDNTGKAGMLDDNNNSVIAHAVVGTELRHDNLSFLAEIRGLYYLVEHQKTDYNPTSIGAFLGMGFAW